MESVARCKASVDVSGQAHYFIQITWTQKRASHRHFIRQGDS